MGELTEVSFPPLELEVTDNFFGFKDAFSIGHSQTSSITALNL